MTPFSAQTDALNALGMIAATVNVELAAIEEQHRSALRAARDSETVASQEAQAVLALVESSLARGRSTLEPIGLETALPRKVRPGPAPADSAAIAASAQPQLDEAHDALVAAVRSLQEFREGERDRNRQEFLDEEARRARAESERIAAELLAKETAQRKAAEDARRRQLILRAMLAGGAVLLVILVVAFS